MLTRNLPVVHAGGFGMGDVPMLPAEEGSLVDDGERSAPVSGVVGVRAQVVDARRERT